MKLFSLIITLLIFQKNYSQQFEYKVLSTIESVVKTKKIGLGGLIAERSRMISEAEPLDYKETTTLRLADQEEEKKVKKRKGDNKSRSEIRTKQYEETKLLNFYNQFGIRFQNIATNDALIISKINELASMGWELAFVSGSAEAMSGYDDPNGIIYTRYIFKREKKQCRETIGVLADNTLILIMESLQFHGDKPRSIPGHPQIIYKNIGWENLSSWLGNTNNKSFKNVNYKSFEEAKEFVKNLNLKTSKDWLISSKTKRPFDIPSNPGKKYKGMGWIGMDDFLGKE